MPTNKIRPRLTDHLLKLFHQCNYAGSFKMSAVISSRTSLGEPNVTIVVGDRRFHCHREVLAVKSAYFKSMFSLDMSEKTCHAVELKDVEPSMVKLLFEYAYNGKCDITRGNVNSLLLVSDMLLFETVRDACMDFLQSHLTVSNCLSIMLLVDSLGMRQLYLQAKQIAFWEFDRVVQQSEFLDLSADQVRCYLSADGLRVQDEISIFNAFLRWVKHWPDERMAEMVNLLNVVRFGIVPQRDLVLICKAIKFSVECYAIVREIWFRKRESMGKKSNASSTRTSGQSSGNLSKAESLQDMAEGMEEEGSHHPELKRRKRCDGSADAVGAGSSAELNVTLLTAKMTALQMMGSVEPRKVPTVPAIIGHIFGGDCDKTRAPDLVVYDPHSKKLSRISVIDKVEQAFQVAVGYKACVIESEVFAVGGEFWSGLARWNSAVWKYNTFTETWKFVSNLEVNRRHHTLAVLNNSIYVIGGVGRFRIPLDSVDVLDVTTGIWTTAAMLPEPLHCPVCTVFKNKIYVFSSDVYRYDPRSNSWTHLRMTRCHKTIADFYPVLALEHAEGIFLVTTTSHLIFFNPEAANAEGTYFQSLGQFRHAVQNACVVDNKVYAFSQEGPLVVESYDFIERTFNIECQTNLMSPPVCSGCFALPRYME